MVLKRGYRLKNRKISSILSKSIQKISHFPENKTRKYLHIDDMLTISLLQGPKWVTKAQLFISNQTFLFQFAKLFHLTASRKASLRAKPSFDIHQRACIHPANPIILQILVQTTTGSQPIPYFVPTALRFSVVVCFYR
jgi:hypothetical protein